MVRPVWVKSGLSSRRYSMSALPLKADIQTAEQDVIRAGHSDCTEKRGLTRSSALNPTGKIASGGLVRRTILSAFNFYSRPSAPRSPRAQMTQIEARTVSKGKSTWQHGSA